MFKKVLFTIASAMLLWIAFSVYMFFRPHVVESTGSLTREEAPPDVTLSGSYPPSAHDIHFARASVGMAGRFLAYRFSGTLADLHEHARAEFESHWTPLTPTTQELDTPPFDGESLEFWHNAYGVRLDWINPDQIGRGVMYLDEHGSSRPMIFVDEDNLVLYFVMTD
jgi:hypothetical protein